MTGTPEPLGDYDLLEEIGRGAVGVVYRARDRRLNREVAIKTLLAGTLASAKSVQRFRTEAAAAARVRHDAIISVHDVGESDGRHFYVMDFVDGESFGRVVERGPVEPEFAARVAVQVGRALQAAHEQDVVHRDVKPSNIIVDREGRAWIADFGLAKALDSDSALTLSGDAIGTPSYMSPEQAAGATDAITPRTDVYGLGAVLYAALAGRAPFIAPTVPATLRLVVDREPIPLRVLEPALPRDLETIVARCLQKDPARRYSSAGEVADDLERWLARTPIVARPVGRIERIRLWAERRPLVAALSGSTILMALVGAFAVTTAWQDARLALQRSVRSEHQRLVAEVRALEDAGAESVGVRIAALRPLRPELVVELRAFAASSLDDGRLQSRVRLALLPIEPDGLAELAQRILMSRSTPGELRMMLETIDAERAIIPVSQWSQFLATLHDAAAGDDSARSLCAVTALVVLGADAATWRGQVGSLARHLASERALRLETWVRMLSPMPRELIEGLRGIFLESDDPGERQRAAELLAECGPGAPDLVAELFSVADPTQFRALAALFDSGSDELLMQIRDAMATVLQAPMAPAPPADDSLPTDLREPVSAAVGFANDAFVVGQDFDGATFETLVRQFGDAGYRPSRIRPFIGGGQLRVAAILVRDDRRWELAWNRSRQQIESDDAAFEARGMRAIEFAGWPERGATAPRYCAVWTDGLKLPRHLSFVQGSTAATFRDRAEAGLTPVSWQFAWVEGVGMHHQSIWEKRSVVPEHFTPEGILPAAMNGSPVPGFCAFDVGGMGFGRDQPDVLGSGEPMRRFGGVFLIDRECETRNACAETPEQHRVAMLELAAVGYAPIAICAHRDSGGAWTLGSSWSRRLPVLAEVVKDATSRARAASTLLHLGASDLVWGAEFAREPTRRSHWIAGPANGAVPSVELTKRLAASVSPAERRVLLLALGQYPPAQLDALARQSIAHAGSTDVDPGVRAAAAWARARADGELRAKLVSGTDAETTPIGQIMVVVPGPNRFVMGSAGGEPGRNTVETPHRREIPRSFALGATEVTEGEFAHFLADHPELRAVRLDPSDDVARRGVSWWNALRFCRWLSERAGLAESEMCYPPVERIGPEIELELPDDLFDRTGYRLPTEAEWEFACRAGAATAFSFGDDVKMLPQFASCWINTAREAQVVAQRMPNALGLFDMHGNLQEWCQGVLAPYPVSVHERVPRDVAPTDLTGGETPRVVRGGSVASSTRMLRSAARLRLPPGYNSDTVGFRIARTVR